MKKKIPSFSKFLLLETPDNLVTILKMVDTLQNYVGDEVDFDSKDMGLPCKSPSTPHSRHERDSIRLGTLSSTHSLSETIHILTVLVIYMFEALCGVDISPLFDDIDTTVGDCTSVMTNKPIKR